MIKFWRALKTAFQYIFRNFGLSFASIIVMTLTFFIVSIVGIAFYGSVRFVKYIDSQPALTVYLRNDLSEEKNKEFETLVNSTHLATEVSIKPIEFSVEDFNNKYPEIVLNDKSKSKIPVMAFIYGNSQENLSQLIQVLSNNDSFMKTMIDTSNLDKISWYDFNNDQAEVIHDANKLLRTSGIAITLFLFLISSILIFITIKLAIQYHKRELEIMDLVGADAWFIKLPFVVDGIIYGILGGLFSSGIIWIFKSFVIQKSQQLVPTLSGFFSGVEWPTLDLKLILQIIGATCLMGAFVGALSSFLAIIKYVKK